MGEGRSRATPWRRVLVFGSMLSVVPLAPIGAAVADPGDITLVTTSDSGDPANAESQVATLSAAGTTVVFSSRASNLDPADTDFDYDIYLKDLETGDTSLVSTSDTGEKANAGSFNWQPVLSDDGTRVAFQSDAVNLDPADTNGTFDIYVKDLVSGDIVLASTSDTGGRADFASYSARLSADGTVVAFESIATNLDPVDGDGLTDVYVKDLTSGALTLVSTAESGEKANGESVGPHLSADGTIVAFVSSATNLHPADTDAFTDVYVKDLRTGRLTLVSTSGNGQKGSDSSFSPRLTADGTKVVFGTWATNLDPPSPVGGIYVKDLQTGALALASTSDSGGTGNSVSSSPDLSDDGLMVVFMSNSTDLDPADDDNVFDIYVKNLETGDLTLTSTNGAGVKGDFGGQSPVLSADGSKVGFESPATNLVPGNTDGAMDIYVKEVGGDTFPVHTCDGIAATILGTMRTEVLTGTPVRDVIVGRGGSDTITGAGGDDLICGSPGHNTVRGGPGLDIVYGGPGHDILYGGRGDDRLLGGSGRDSLTGGAGDFDICFGGAGLADTAGVSCEFVSGVP